MVAATAATAVIIAAIIIIIIFPPWHGIIEPIIEVGKTAPAAPETVAVTAPAPAALRTDLDDLR